MAENPAPDTTASPATSPTTPPAKRNRVQVAPLVGYVVAIAGAIYCIYFTRWGGLAYTGLSYAMLIFTFFASIYAVLKMLLLSYRARHPHAVHAEPHPLAPSGAGSDIAPAVKTPFFHDDPSRKGRSGIGMPALWNFGAPKTMAITVFLAAAAGLVHYLSAQPSRQQALQITGFLGAVALYLWLLVVFAIRAFRWMRRHLHPPTPTGKYVS